MNREDWRDVAVIAVTVFTTVDVLFSPWFILLDVALAAVVLSLLARARRHRIRAGLTTGRIR